MKKIGVFDLDGTVYRDTLTFAVAEKLLEQTELRSEQRQVEAAKQVWKERASPKSYWTYNTAILEAFGQITPKVSPEQLEIAVEKVLDDKKKYCYAYTTDLITKLKQEGRALIAMSGSITNIVEPFARSLGFDIIISSDLEIVDGTYTGKRVSQTNKSKDLLLRTVVEEYGLTLEDSIGIGDTHRDISLLAAVKNPIAFNPNAALYEEAARRGWKVVIERKNMIFELIQKKDTYVVESAYPNRDGKHHEQLR